MEKDSKERPRRFAPTPLDVAALIGVVAVLALSWRGWPEGEGPRAAGDAARVALARQAGLAGEGAARATAGGDGGIVIAGGAGPGRP